MVKKKTLMAGLLAVGALAVTGATLAYFTGTDQAANVVTTGNVEIALFEDAKDPSMVHGTWTAEARYPEPGAGEGLVYGNVKPGDKLVKVPVVFNTGKNDAYVRLKVQINLYDRNGDLMTGVPETEMPWLEERVKRTGHMLPDGGDSSFIDDKNLRQVYPDQDGYLYHDRILPAGGGHAYTAFDVVRIPENWTNKYMGVGVEIVLTAEAVQSDYMDVGDRTGVEAAKYAFGVLRDTQGDPFAPAEQEETE